MRWVAVLLVSCWAGLAVAGPHALRDAAACVGRGPQAKYTGKTAYELVCASDDEAVPRDQLDGGCDAVFYWHLCRHGTRYPGKDELRDMTATLSDLQTKIKANQDSGKVTLCADDTNSILAWKLDEQANSNADQLTDQGQDDMYDIGKRFRARYPRLIGDHSDVNGQYTFRAAKSQRTQDSAAWYAKGISRDDYELKLPTPIADDPLLESYKVCPAWDNAVANNATALGEADKFKASSHMTDALSRISKRLGFTDSLTYDEVFQMWDACRYEQAWDPTVPATWCAAFDSEDLSVFEYHSDLQYYYKESYGHDINLQVGCPLVKDLVDTFTARILGATQPAAGVVYFTHSTALEMTLARLGVGRNDSQLLTADNYESLKTDRTWSVSKLVPFASNVAFVLYQCQYGDERYKIKPYVNERPVPMDGCETPGTLCSWLEFQQQFSSIASQCSLDFCGKPEPTTPGTNQPTIRTTIEPSPDQPTTGHHAASTLPPSTSTTPASAAPGTPGAPSTPLGLALLLLGSVATLIK